MMRMITSLAVLLVLLLSAVNTIPAQAASVKPPLTDAQFLMAQGPHIQGCAPMMQRVYTASRAVLHHWKSDAWAAAQGRRIIAACAQNYRDTMRIDSLSDAEYTWLYDLISFGISLRGINGEGVAPLSLTFRDYQVGVAKMRADYKLVRAEWPHLKLPTF